MEPLGLYLKQVREGKKLTIDKVIEDTFIMKKFILAIEDDDFSSFPGEAYLKGFLRNYGEYLGLDPADLISRYERIKMSETPSPTELLIPKPKAFFSKILLKSGLIRLWMFQKRLHYQGLKDLSVKLCKFLLKSA